MIEKIDNNLIRDIQEAASHATGSPRKEAAEKADASLEVQFASLLEQARQAPQDDTETRRSGETAIRGQRSEVGGQRTHMKKNCGFRNDGNNRGGPGFYRG